MANPLAVARVKTDSSTLDPIKKALEQFLTGKDKLAEVLLCSILAKGTFFFEDIPGVGKRRWQRGFPHWLGLSMARVQCTSDLLPSDILGIEVFLNSQESFVFHHCPVAIASSNADCVRGEARLIHRQYQLRKIWTRVKYE